MGMKAETCWPGMGKPPVGSPIEWDRVKELGCIGWWDFVEGNGLIAVSRIGNNPGTLTSNPSRVAGIFGQALNCPNAGYVDIPHSPIFNLASAGSFTVWLNIDPAITMFGGWYRTIFSKHSSSNTANSDAYKFAIGISAVKCSVSVYDGTTEQSLTGNTTLPTGRWIHLAATFDGANMNVYLNGRPDGSVAQTVTPVFTVNKSERIGQSQSSSANARNVFSRLDNVRVYNRALTQQEIIEEAYTAPYSMVRRPGARVFSFGEVAARQDFFTLLGVS